MILCCASPYVVAERLAVAEEEGQSTRADAEGRLSLSGGPHGHGPGEPLLNLWLVVHHDLCWAGCGAHWGRASAGVGLLAAFPAVSLPQCPRAAV